MEIEGRIAHVLPARSGVSNTTGSEWKAQDFVLEFRWFANQQDPSKMVFTLFGADRLDRWRLEVNDEIRLKYSHDAVESNGRWFNKIRGYEVTFIGGSAWKNPQVAATPPAQATTPQPAISATPFIDPTKYPPAPPSPASHEEHDALTF